MAWMKRLLRRNKGFEGDPTPVTKKELEKVSKKIGGVAGEYNLPCQDTELSWHIYWEDE